MPSKSAEAHERILKLRKEIEKRKAQMKLMTNLRQKALKQKKIDAFTKEIKDLLKSIHGKTKKRKVYIPDPD